MRTKKPSRARMAAVAVALLCLSACDSIYDDPAKFPPPTDEDGVFHHVDATSYTQWVYIDLDGHQKWVRDHDDTIGVPTQWDIALHRYDVKTNGGGGYESTYGDIDDLVRDLESGEWMLPPDVDFASDVADSIVTDMSTMMEGYLGKAASMVNPVLGQWIDVDMSTMPPIYTLSGKVYLLRRADGSLVALRFTGFTNPEQHNEKGWISFEYKPVEQ